jgi:hypothetical protein
LATAIDAGVHNGTATTRRTQSYRKAVHIEVGETWLECALTVVQPIDDREVDVEHVFIPFRFR